jgi:hypothetical protein
VLIQFLVDQIRDYEQITVHFNTTTTGVEIPSDPTATEMDPLVVKAQTQVLT